MATPPPAPNRRPEVVEPTIGALVHDLTEQVPQLVRSEIRLAQAEVTQKGKRLGAGIGMFSAGGLLAFFALGTAVATAVLALDLAMAAWAAALIVTIALLALAAGAALLGKKNVEEATPLTPEHAVAGIQEDISTLKGIKP